MKTKTYLCRDSEDNSESIIEAFEAIDIGTTTIDNDAGRCLIVCTNNPRTVELAQRLNLEDVTPTDEEEHEEIFKALDRLGTVCIRYVEAANYDSRVQSAKEAFCKGIAAAKAGDLATLKAVRIISRG